MLKILAVIIILLAILILIFAWFIFSKGIDILFDYKEKYNKRTLIYIESVEQLKDLILAKEISCVRKVSVINENMVKVVGVSGIHKFYIEDGKIQAVFPSSPIGISRISNLIFILTIKSTLKRAREIARIFECLNENNDIHSVENENISKRINKVISFWNLFVGCIIAVVVLFSVCSFLNDFQKSYGEKVIEYVKQYQAVGVEYSIGENVDMMEQLGCEVKWEYRENEGVEYVSLIVSSEYDGDMEVIFKIDKKPNDYPVLYDALWNGHSSEQLFQEFNEMFFGSDEFEYYSNGNNKTLDSANTEKISYIEEKATEEKTTKEVPTEEITTSEIISNKTEISDSILEQIEGLYVDENAYIGKWVDTYSSQLVWEGVYNQSCNINIFYKDDGTYNIDIYRSYTPYESASWTLIGKYDESKKTIEYTGMKNMTLSSDYDPNSIVREEAKGNFYIEDGNLYWDDEISNDGEKCVFVKDQTK